MTASAQVSCPNEGYVDYGKTGGNSITILGKYGKNHDKALLDRRTYENRFVST
jgi:hypothetical protein